MSNVAELAPNSERSGNKEGITTITYVFPSEEKYVDRNPGLGVMFQSKNNSDVALGVVL